MGAHQPQRLFHVRLWSTRHRCEEAERWPRRHGSSSYLLAWLGTMKELSTVACIPGERESDLSLPRWCTRSMLRKSMVDSLVSEYIQPPAMERRVRPLEPYMHACRTDGLPSLACRWCLSHALVSRKSFLRARTTWAYGA
ncbi:uncharacterized protein SCHCODRAFT_02304379 [Schizophyllum commune H4-8]|uniref:uncharacterized protein n=1 Tax=Schizophyllum commune (strain H4-8 / FGSC 9210) TaxID=578458 RepID=UPI00215F4682|nr:uncharacterized protein SCHCODRAFT_02304379 [Schizophyllum commune H4-8]KAI5892896.1 hypothetical protein SCHCODRAFT_02304379 [Schizophyllum commune H4-8]